MVNQDSCSGHYGKLHRLDVGEHTIRVSLVLETQWAPKLRRITANEI